VIPKLEAKNKRVFLNWEIDEEAGAATLGSVPGRGGFSYGNNPMDPSDTTRGSGEAFGGLVPMTDAEKKRLKKRLNIMV
jgi:hypothetical protein